MAAKQKQAASGIRRFSASIVREKEEYMAQRETQSAGRRLRELLKGGMPVVAPGVGDAISARLVEEAGFLATCMSGAWASALRGYPDVGLITLDQMVQNAAHIAEAVSIPVISDADTGFGDVVNVRRCVREFERAGVAGIHIEDQALPKKCGLLAGKIIVTEGEMTRKLRVACDARQDQDFIIIARTDALQTEGLASTIERGQMYFDAGADMLFVEGLRQEAEVEAVAEAFRGRLLFFNRTPRGHAPMMDIQRLHELGYQFIVYPIHLVLLSAATQRAFLEELRETGACESFEDKMLGVAEFFRLLGSDSVDDLIDRYMSDGAVANAVGAD